MASNVLTSRTIRGITYNTGDSFVCAYSAKGNAGSEGDGNSAAALTVGDKYYFLGYVVAADSGTTIKYPCRVGSGSSTSSAIGYYPESVFPYATYTIKYNDNKGSGAPSNQTKTYGTTLTLSSTKPTRSGYTFKGWATSSTGSVVYSSGDNYTSNSAVTLYAVWEENKLTVNYYSNYATSAFDGALNTVGSSKNVKVWTYDFYYDNDYSTYGLANYSNSSGSVYMTRTGYTGTGNWGTSTSGGILINENTKFATGQAIAETLGKSLKTGNASINLYAQWTTKSYIITFDSGHSSNLSLDWNDSFTLDSSNFKKDGYKFIGWNLYRQADSKYYVTTYGWLTEDVINENNYTKKIYANQDTLTIDNSWVRDCETATSFTFYTIWEISGVIYIDNGTSFEPYVPYIDNGESWDLYLAYVDDGTNWTIIS